MATGVIRPYKLSMALKAAKRNVSLTSGSSSSKQNANPGPKYELVKRRRLECICPSFVSSYR